MNDLFIGNVLPNLGKLNAMLKNLCKQVGVDDPNEVIRMVNAGELEIRERDKSSLLKPAGVPITIGGTDKFRAVDWFKKGGVMDDGVRILINGPFREHFLGKTEKNVPEARVAAHELTDDRNSLAVLTALGGEKRAELQLAHISKLMLIQEWAVSSPVKIGGYARCDCCDRLWTVHANWEVGNRVWYVSAYSVENSRPRPWNRDRRVFSRDL